MTLPIPYRLVSNWSVPKKQDSGLLSLHFSYNNKDSTQTSRTKHDTPFLPLETHSQFKAQPPSGASVWLCLYFQSQRWTQTKKRLAAHNLADAQSEGNLPFVFTLVVFYFTRLCVYTKRIWPLSRDTESARIKKVGGRGG